MIQLNTLQEAQIALAVEQKKTNGEWYLFERLGSYFKFENGTLLQCPMNKDRTRDNSPCEIDWERIDEDLKRSLKAVAQVLAAYP